MITTAAGAWRAKLDLMTAVETVLAFIEAINRHDVDQLIGLLTEDHAFIDSLGNSLRGREKIRAGWRGYFAMCPDYRVSHEDIFRDGNTVAMFGSAGGTISVNGQIGPREQMANPRGVARRSPRRPDSRVASLRRQQTGL